MDRIKDALSKVNTVVVILALLGIRAIVDANMAQALIVACFSGVYALQLYLASIKKIDVQQNYIDDLNSLRNNVSALMIKNASRPQEERPTRMF